ncbi:branched-chain amino acid ABC transporter permease [archaeon]|nr:MAG: branched-chain amino acid ABC transporter permease [archaeon]
MCAGCEVSVRFSGRHLILALAIIPVFVLPLFADQYILSIIVLTCIYAYAAKCWDIVGGYAGQYSMGHAAYFGIGAYVSSMMFLVWKITPLIGMFAGAATAAVAGTLIGAVSLRRMGIYYSMITLAFAEVLRYTVLSLDELGGARGLLLPVGNNALDLQFSRYEYFYYIILVMILILLFICRRIEKSRFGLYLAAIREDEDAAKSLGIDTFNCKLKANVISSALIALSGSIYAQFCGFVAPWTVLSLFFSVALIVYSAFGGSGILLGPLLGAVVLVPTTSFINARLGGYLPGINIVIYGVILIVVILFTPNGIHDHVARLYQAVSKSRR